MPSRKAILRAVSPWPARLPTPDAVAVGIAFLAGFHVHGQYIAHLNRIQAVVVALVDDLAIVAASASHSLAPRAQAGSYSKLSMRRPL